MARKKKSESHDAELLLGSMADSDGEDLDLPEELEQALAEMEEEVAAELEEEADSEESLENEEEFGEDDGDEEDPEPEASDEPEMKAPPKRKAARKTRAASKSRKRKSTPRKAAAKTEEQVVEELPAPEAQAGEPETATKKPARKRSRKAAAKKSETVPPAVPSDDAEGTERSAEAPPTETSDAPAETLVAAASAEASPAMVKQWASVKDISEAISKNFERVNDMLKEIPERQKLELQKIARQTRRAPWAARMAVAASVLAVILSVVSLSLVSSMRRAMIMGGQMPAATTPQRPAMAPPPVRKAPIREAGLAPRIEKPAEVPAAREQRVAKKPKETFRKKASVAHIKWRKRGYRPAFHR